MDVPAVLALAPDRQVAASATKLAAPANWSELGHDEDALWGLCKGSGQQPYQVCVDLVDRATKCSCPSRKFPCKHAIAVQVLHAQDGVAAAEPPVWVHEWQQRRQARSAPKVLDESPEAVERRAASRARTSQSREAAVLSGAIGLGEWLGDLARGGIAALPGRDRDWWDSITRRMVDAQAPGLAAALTELGGVVRAGGPRWAEEAADRLGSLHLLTTLAPNPPAELAAVVRSRLGFTTTEEEAKAAPGWPDRWVVVLREDTDDAQVRTVRQWAWGRQRREWVVVIRHSFVGAGTAVGPILQPGAEITAVLHPYPGGAPRRVALGELSEVGPAGPMELPATWSAALSGLEPLLRADPWQRQFPLGCQGVRLARAGDGLSLVDAEQRAIAVRHDPAVDRALAWHGGAEFDAIGLWDGWTLRLGAASSPGGAPEVLA